MAKNLKSFAIRADESYKFEGESLSSSKLITRISFTQIFFFILKIFYQRWYIVSVRVECNYMSDGPILNSKYVFCSIIIFTKSTDFKNKMWHKCIDLVGRIPLKCYKNCDISNASVVWEANLIWPNLVSLVL